MRTRESEEMYLETILLLKQKSANVHSVDVVGELNYAKSSVSRGMNLLVKNGYITMDRVTGVIEFTEKGRESAGKNRGKCRDGGRKRLSYRTRDFRRNV